MFVIGHRGARARAPENTIEAFDLALRDGADGIEFDVLLTADGVPVISHEDHLGRTHGIEARISQLRLDQLRDAARSVPTLEEVLVGFAGRTRLFVELKAIMDAAEGFRSSALVAEAVVGSLSGIEDLVVSSFDPAGPARCRQAGISIAHGVFAAASCTPFITIARNAGCAQIHPEAVMVDEGVVEAAHREGLAVIAWTVNDRDEANKFEAMGVDGIFCDDPAVVG